MEITKVVIRKQWVKSDSFCTYQILKFSGDECVSCNLNATADEGVTTVLENQELKFDAKNNDTGNAIISIMTWTK